MYCGFLDHICIYIYICMIGVLLGLDGRELKVNSIDYHLNSCIID